MTMTFVLAHASHWLVNLVYFIPVVVVLGFLGLQNRRDAKRARLRIDGVKGPDEAGP